jgi:hypothetical protein
MNKEKILNNANQELKIKCSNILKPRLRGLIRIAPGATRCDVEGYTLPNHGVVEL